MHKKSQALIISLWVIVILTILAISIGHRVSMALYISKYQKNRLKAIYLAKAGINRAIVELDKDNKTYDSLQDSWTNNEDVFRHILINDFDSDFAAVSYNVREDTKEETIFGLIDEERKININTASKELLVTLFMQCGMDSTNAAALAQDVLSWRGSVTPVDATLADYYNNNLGYPCKGSNLSTIEELTLINGASIKELEEKKLDLDQLKALITVYGDGKINLNTAPKIALKSLASTAAASFLPGLSINEEEIDELIDKILTFRAGESGFFQPADLTTERIKELLGLNDVATDNRTKIIDKLMNPQTFSVVSNHFNIIATGKTSKVNKTISVIIKRVNPVEILYWHEN